MKGLFLLMESSKFDEISKSADAAIPGPDFCGGTEMEFFERLQFHPVCIFKENSTRRFGCQLFPRDG